MPCSNLRPRHRDPTAYQNPTVILALTCEWPGPTENILLPLTPSRKLAWRHEGDGEVLEGLALRSGVEKASVFRGVGSRVRCVSFGSGSVQPYDYSHAAPWRGHAGEQRDSRPISYRFGGPRAHAS